MLPDEAKELKDKIVLVSASLQDIIRRFKIKTQSSSSNPCDLALLPEFHHIDLNNSDSVSRGLTVLELIRLL